MVVTRREFCGAGGLLVGAGLGAAVAVAGPAVAGRSRLRPPGARPEAEFLAACIRCGQCVIACPHDSLLMAGGGLAVDSGTPYLETRTVPCYLCRDQEQLRCIDVCPATALEAVPAIAAIRIGVAVIDEQRCLAYNGVTCRVCWRACPLPDEAIGFNQLLQPVVDAEHCIGCGLCDYACLTEQSSIPIRPRTADEEARRGK